MNQLLSVLENTFGYKSFRTGQAEIIQNIMLEKDSLGIMPTGGGNQSVTNYQLCYWMD